MVSKVLNKKKKIIFFYRQYLMVNSSRHYVLQGQRLLTNLVDTIKIYAYLYL